MQHADLGVDELCWRHVRHLRVVVVAGRVLVVANLDAPAVGRVREVAQHVAGAAAPARRELHAVVGIGARPEREAALVVRREADLAAAERRRVLHPVVGAKIRRREDSRVEARVVGARLVRMVDRGGRAVVVCGVRRVEVGLRRVPVRRLRGFRCVQGPGLASVGWGRAGSLRMYMRCYSGSCVGGWG